MIAAAGLLLIYLLRQLPKLFRRMGGGQPKGRWVNDRSLGGKAVSRHHCPCVHHLIDTVSVCVPAVCSFCSPARRKHTEVSSMPPGFEIGSHPAH